MRKFILISLLLLFNSGCLWTTPYWLRRATVHDDLVLVKETGIVYRRYIPHGIRLCGNPVLLDQVGSITATNNKIKVFANYTELVNSGITFTLDAESEPHIRKEVLPNEQ